MKTCFSGIPVYPQKTRYDHSISRCFSSILRISILCVKGVTKKEWIGGVVLMTGQEPPNVPSPEIMPYSGLMNHWFPLIMPYQTFISEGGT